MPYFAYETFNEKFLILLLVTFSLSSLVAQDLYRSEYPEGLYAIKEDFIAKTPGSTAEIFPQRYPNSTGDKKESVPDEMFFRYESSKSKRLFIDICLRKGRRGRRGV